MLQTTMWRVLKPHTVSYNSTYSDMIKPPQLPSYEESTSLITGMTNAVRCCVIERADHENTILDYSRQNLLQSGSVKFFPRKILIFMA